MMTRPWGTGMSDDEWALISELCQKFPGFENLPVEEAQAFLQAHTEDLCAEIAEDERRQFGVALADLDVLAAVMAPFAKSNPDITLNSVATSLRAKRRLGHRQQQALELLDRLGPGFELPVRAIER